MTQGGVVGEARYIRHYQESTWGLSGLCPLTEPINPSHTSKHASAWPSNPLTNG